MKVIYITEIIKILGIVERSVRDVQQSLYMGKPKYILKILKNW